MVTGDNEAIRPEVNELYQKLVAVVSGRDGQPALAALLWVVVYAARSTGVKREVIHESLDKVWDGAERGQTG